MKRRRRRKKNRHIPIPVASMGDIAFLLIIFFMILGEFAKDKDLPIELPDSEHVTQTKAVVAARVAMDGQGTIWFDGEPVSSSKDIEWGVRALLANTVRDDQRHVQFKCDRALRKEQFEPIIKAIVEGGGILEAVGNEP